MTAAASTISRGALRVTLSKTDPQTVTRLLNEAAGGQPAAAQELFPLVYDQLRALASGYFRDQAAGHTLQPTALVHEAYVKLVGSAEVRWRSRRQFFVLASKAMRSILVDHARRKNRAKRGGGWQKVSIDVAEAFQPAGSVGVLDMLALDEALSKLAQLDTRQEQLVELRFFGGLKAEEAAEVLGISTTTATDEWRVARAWLQRLLTAD